MERREIGVSATEDTPPGAASTGVAGETAYQQIQRSPEFQALRSRWRRYIFVMSGLFLAWFVVYVLLSGYATGLVNTRIGGSNITVGLVLGLLQFLSTFVITTLYVRYADRNLDPEAETLKRAVEEKL